METKEKTIEKLDRIISYTLGAAFLGFILFNTKSSSIIGGITGLVISFIR